MEENEKSKIINNIVSEARDLKVDEITEPLYENIASTLISSINGDNIEKSLVIPAKVDGENNGILIYIKTNKNIVCISVGREVTSAIYQLSAINIARNITENGKRTKVSVNVGVSTVFGLEYNTEDTKITDFFSSVEAGC